MKFKKEYYKKSIITLMLASVSVFLAATYVLPYAILKPKRLLLEIDPGSISSNYEPVSIAINEVDSLRGFLFKPVYVKPKAIIILVHGIGGSKEHFFPLAQKLAQDGYSTLTIDNRAHGDSDGSYATYGYKEKDDIALLVNFLKQRSPSLKIGVWGSSMGGAIAIQAMEQDERIAFGVVESTFTNLEQIVYDYQKRFSAGIGLRFLTDYVIQRAGIIADFDPKRVSPENAVKSIEQPMFLAHGDKDERIAYQYGEQLFNNLASSNKSFELVKGAGHLNLGEIGGEAYYNKVLVFISRQLEY
jgi:alpha-beta hydrolase superfamily lysophospholipase